MANRYVLPLETLRMTDVPRVGGKNASLGELISQLAASGVRVPGGFATTAEAFNDFLAHNKLAEAIDSILAKVDVENMTSLAAAGSRIRAMVEKGTLPPELEKQIRDDYARVSAGTPSASFAVRSSATAEDLPDASFAGQQETYLNIRGAEHVLEAVRRVYASLYNDRAIAYRVHKGYSHGQIAISAGVQRMVRSDLGTAGVMFTMDTESGFRSQRPRHRLSRAQGLLPRADRDLRGRAAHGEERPRHRGRHVHHGHGIGIPIATTAPSPIACTRATPTGRSRSPRACSAW